MPDVLASRLVLRDSRQGFEACLWALGGALLGGTTIFLLAAAPETAAGLLRFFDHLPGISREMVAQARTDVDRQGWGALFTGAATGVPYKLYAVHLAQAGFSLPAFLAVSALARLLRFVVVTALAWLSNRALAPRLGLPARQWLHAAAWTGFYVWYFAIVAA